MTESQSSSAGEGWICNRCRMPLESLKVRLQYGRSVFAFHLPGCPVCGMALVGEELAVVKMREAEQVLEDK